MAKQNSTEILREQIRQLEIEQAEELKLFKEQLNVTFESLKPINLLKSSAQEFATSEKLRETVIESTVMLVSGSISKKILDSTTGGPLIKLLTSLFQLGANKLVDKYGVQIQNFILGLVNQLLKEDKVE